MRTQYRPRVHLTERPRDTRGSCSPCHRWSVNSTPQFLKHLRFLLRDLTSQKLPEGLSPIFQSYLTFKPCLFKAEDEEPPSETNAKPSKTDKKPSSKTDQKPFFETRYEKLVDKWVDSPLSFLDLIPPGDNLVYRLYQGSRNSDDPVVKRLCTTLFFRLRTNFNDTFHSIGHSDSFAQYFSGYEMKTTGDYLSKARQLSQLYDKGPALLLLSVKKNITDFEIILPNDDYRIQDTVEKLPPESVKICNGIKLVFEYFEASWRQWLYNLKQAGKRKEQADIGSDNGRKKSTRASIKSILGSVGGQTSIVTHTSDWIPEVSMRAVPESRPLATFAINFPDNGTFSSATFSTTDLFHTGYALPEEPMLGQ
ncbi:hypothetical protein EDB81DRAFT_770813 [Dactylonectria macrodidyma]|uniref:Uncharacterized protein n=1 Tax=Dactylonectria macrodidyma TaxID=307937 RepID=A0A9P9FR61_9HYPO|nr:hypothetical protein EDB81DRAFT_770813 [Dactylonectria macrodidyma]